MELLCLLHHISIYSVHNCSIGEWVTCVKRLVDLSKWRLLYGEKFGFCKMCAHGKQHRGVDFGDFTLLHPNK